MILFEYEHLSRGQELAKESTDQGGVQQGGVAKLPLNLPPIAALRICS